MNEQTGAILALNQRIKALEGIVAFLILELNKSNPHLRDTIRKDSYAYALAPRPEYMPDFGDKDAVHDCLVKIEKAFLVGPYPPNPFP